LKKSKKKVIWFTGLSGSGKTTLANQLSIHLKKSKYTVNILDGDEVRAGLCSDLKFSDKDRKENIRRVAELASLLIKQSDYVIVATISPNNQLRSLAKKIIGNDFFKLVYLSTSLDSCQSRDPKGLYKKAFAGEIKNFTGLGATFESPTSFDLKIDTSEISIKQSIEKIISMLNIK